jgi:hypothetical protein
LSHVNLVRQKLLWELRMTKNLQDQHRCQEYNPEQQELGFILEMRDVLYWMIVMMKVVEEE